jgi:hypothetical protein
MRKGNNTSEKDTDVTKICQQSQLEVKEKLYFLFSKVEYKNAQLICKTMGGKMPLPTKEKDFNATIGEEFYSNSINKSHCNKLWLPIVQVTLYYIFHIVEGKYVHRPFS